MPPFTVSRDINPHRRRFRLRGPEARRAEFSELHASRPSDPGLQRLLHRRLFLLSLIAAGGGSLDFVHFSIFGTAVFVGNAHAAYILLGSTLIAGMLLAAVFLSRFRDLSIARLRWIETAIIGALAGFGCWATFVILSEFLPRLLRDGQSVAPTTFLSQSVAMFWVTLIAGYGFLIPNGWRRNLVAISVLGFLPLLLVTYVGFMEPHATPGDIVLMLSRVGVWLAIAACLALYGGHRIESLRRQVHLGQQLGQYRLRQRIGSGGMGEVYLADHALLRRPCAVKVIHPNRIGDSSTLKRFEREAQATAELTSPHTVDVYDFGRTKDGLFYYVMEYVPGVDLDRFVKKNGPLPPARVINVSAATLQRSTGITLQGPDSPRH